MNLQIPADSVPIGYSALVDRYALRVIPHHRWSFVATKGMPREFNDGRVVLRSGFADPPAMTEVDHLTFSTTSWRSAASRLGMSSLRCLR